MTERKPTSFEVPVPKIDLDNPIPETPYGGRAVTKYCPTLGPRRCPYIETTKTGIMKCSQYAEPWKKWQRDKRCYMYDTHNWDEEE